MLCIYLQKWDIALSNSTYYKDRTYNRDIFLLEKTVRIIETVLITINQTRVRSYGTYNRDVVESFETVLIIESVLIIGT